MQHLCEFDNLRDKRLVDNCGLGSGDGLFGEYLGDVVGVLCEVRSSATPFCDVRHQVHIGTTADAHSRNRYPLAAHRIHDAVPIARLRMSVAEDDDVFNFGLGLGQGARYAC